MSYLTTLAFLRYRSVWMTLLPVGAVTIINVTYQPGSTSPYLWAFLLLCLITIAHATSRGRIEALLAQGVVLPASLHRKSLVHGLWISAALVVLAAALPLGEIAIFAAGLVLQPRERDRQRRDPGRGEPRIRRPKQP